ncbi:hypothetical protein Bbelb_186960 [Branchiostoma belcheri]|nr:hypothetical protein Bbelb_186960 [Branchiostoma belcheri]
MSIWETKYSKSMHMVKKDWWIQNTEGYRRGGPRRSYRTKWSSMREERGQRLILNGQCHYSRRCSSVHSHTTNRAVAEAVVEEGRAQRINVSVVTEKDTGLGTAQKTKNDLNEELKMRLEALENAHRTEGVREALEQVLNLAKAPSHLNHALLIPALRGLGEKARVAGHTDYPTTSTSISTSPNLPATEWIDKEGRCVSTVGPIPEFA